MKTKFILWVFVLLLLVGTVSAWDFDNVKSYEPYAKEITITNAFGFGSQLAVYKLTDNSYYCLIDCYAEGTAILYDSEALFSSIRFMRNLTHEFIDVEENYNTKIYIQTREEYQKEIPQTEEVCNNLILENGTYQKCNYVRMPSIYETAYRDIWNLYNGENLQPGVYTWRIEGKKQSYENLDWIASAFDGNELTEWATWGDGSWGYKNIMNTQRNGGGNPINVPTLVNNGALDTKTLITAGKLNADCSDLRVTNSSETAEQNILILNECNQANTSVLYLGDYGFGTGNHTAYSYYDNTGNTTLGNPASNFQRKIGIGAVGAMVFLFNSTTNTNITDLNGSNPCLPINSPKKVVVDNAKWGYSTSFASASSQSYNCGDNDAMVPLTNAAYILVGYWNTRGGEETIYGKKDGSDHQFDICSGCAGYGNEFIVATMGYSGKVATHRALGNGEAFAVVITYNASHISMIWNGGVENVSASNSLTANDLPVCIGGDFPAGGGCVSSRYANINLSLLAVFPYEVSYDWANQFTYNMVNGSGFLGTEQANNQAPTAPKIFVPTNNTIWNTTTPIIQISNSSDADGNQINYTLTIANTSAFSAIHYINNTIIERANTTKVYILSGILSDGNYWVRINATDGFSWSGYAYANFTIQSPIPDIYLIHPQNRTYNTTSVSLNVSTTSQIYSVWQYSLDSGSFTTFTPNITLSSLSQGSHTINITINDSYNRINSTIKTFFVDSIYPSIDYQNPTPLNNSYSNKTTFSINISTTDTNFINITFILGNSSFINTTTFTDATRLLTYYGLADRNYTYNVTVCDTSSNCNISSTRKILVDTTLPVVSLIAPLNQTYTSIQTTLNCSINDSYLDTCWYSTNAGATNTTFTCGSMITDLNSGQGSSTWMCAANDSAQNSFSNKNTFYVDSVMPLIDYQAPTLANNTNQTSYSYIEVNVSVTESSEVNITFILANSTSIVNETTFTAAVRYFKHSANLPSDTYHYNVTVCDVVSNCNTTGTRTLTIDYNPPAVSILYPGNSSYNSNNLNLNISCLDATTLCTGNIYSFNNGVTNTTFTPNTTITASEGSNTLTYFANDSLNNWNKTQVTFNVDSTPPIVTLYQPLNLTYGSGTGLPLNFSIYELNPSSNYYEVYSITTSSTEIQKTLVTANTTFNLANDGQYNLTLFSNDTINNTKSSSVIFAINSKRINSFSQNYDASTFENSIIDFGSIVEINNVTTNDINSVLIYNNTNYASIKTVLGDNKYMFNVSLTVPLIENPTVTKTFSWNYSINLLNGTTIYNSTYGGSQSVQKIIIRMCNISALNVSLGLNLTLIATIYDEEEPTSYLNASLETNMLYWKEDKSMGRTFYNKSDKDYKYYFCLNLDSQNVSSDIYFKYATDNGFTQRFFFNNYTLDSSSYKNISLYNFNSTSGKSDLRITTRYFDTYQYYPGVFVTLQRNYVGEGIWRDVQMDKSGDYGLAFFNIREEDTDYKLVFKDLENHVLRTTDSMTFSCSSGICDLVFQLSPYSSTVNGTQVMFTSSFNNQTKMIIGNWSASNTITLRFFAKKPTMSYNNLCEVIQTGDTGNFSCNLSRYTGEVYISAEGNNATIFSEYIKVTTNKLGDIIGSKEGAWWAFVIILIIVMFGIFSPAGAVISLIIGLVAIYFLGIFNPLTITLLAVACVIGIIIGLKVRT